VKHLLLHRLKREHARLDDQIARESRARVLDAARLSSLKKRRLVVKDRITSLQADGLEIVVA